MLKIINTDTDDDTDTRTSLHYISRFFISNFKIFQLQNIYLFQNVSSLMLGDHPLITNAKLSELTFLTPIIHTQTCAYQGARNVKFFGKLHVLLNGRSLYILRHYCSHHIATIQLVEIFQMHIEDTVKKSVLTRFSTCKFSFKQEYRSYIIPKRIEVVFNAMH